MTQIESYQSDEDADDQQEEAPSGLRRQISRVTRERDELKSQLTAFQAQQSRDLAFAAANLPDSKTAQFFRQHYDGEVSTEAIRQAAIDLGIVPDTTPETASQISQLAAQSQALDGANPPMAPGTEEAMWEEVNREIAKVQPHEVGRTIERVLRKHGRPTASDDR